MLFSNSLLHEAVRSAILATVWLLVHHGDFGI